MCDGRTQRTGDALHHRDALDPEQCLGDSVEHDHVGGIAHVMVGLDGHDVGIETGCAEMLFGRRVPDVGRDVSGNVAAVVVTGLVAHHGQDAEQHDGSRRGQNRLGPPDRRRTDPAPAFGLHHALGIQQPEPAAHDQDGGGDGHGGGHDDD